MIITESQSLTFKICMHIYIYILINVKSGGTSKDEGQRRVYLCID